MKSNVDILLEGNRITDGKRILSFDKIVLKDEKGSEVIMPMDLLLSEEYYLYQTPEQIEIARLKEIIEKQNQEIQNLSKPKIKRKSYKKLDPDEVEDIEAQFEAGKLPKEVYEAFGISRSSATRHFDRWLKYKRA